ncbi:Pyoverdine/dityrosine biosynthesis protein-domain-containing protein [Xylaria cf. heliscus]|nr:Pyoverdine/dityrosine biosynthesis protein-domain-containing protein [Xylaria cf. heliscus]
MLYTLVMASSTINYGSSPFHSILGLYCRGPDGQLLNTEGREAGAIAHHWSAIFEQLKSGKTTFTPLPSGLLVETSCIDILSNLSDTSSHQSHIRLRAREIYRETSKCYVGILSYQSQDDHEGAFREWIETLFVLRTTLQPRLDQGLQASTRSDYKSVAERIWEWVKALFAPKITLQAQPDPESKASVGRNQEFVAEQITALFERMLRNTAATDEWDCSGRNYFFHRVLDFVSRNEACEMALPAFPCKSPNDAKVGGSRPDMAERIALETLCAFVKSVKKVYAPGVTIWVIHDGHLLSSCIGVDDDVVSEYESNLQELYRSMFDSSADRGAIKFCGLSDLFFSGPDNTQTFDQSWILDPDLLNHPIQTKLSTTAEIARKLVMASCGIDRAHFRGLILARDAATLKLYRGLSHFMLQDLTGPSFAGQSTSRKKKTASSVAAEMIARNQAYSNLLELLFPNYIRLSIHAHNNRGPKFGIRLFPRERVRAIDDVDGRHEPVPRYDFQIPTPWHNSIVKVEGDEIAYLTKACVARQAIESGRYIGGWVDDGDGRGHFSLREVGRELLRSKADDGKIEVVSVADDDVEVKVKVKVETKNTLISPSPLCHYHEAGQLI